MVYLPNSIQDSVQYISSTLIKILYFSNQIGTYGLAMAALELKKPVYVLTESFKFSRIYPLNQQDLPKEFKYLSSVLKSGKDLSKQHPLVDYTPPAYITLLFTDLGILTPSAVSDELIKLYL